MKTSVYKHSIFVVFVLTLTLAMSVTTAMAQSFSQELIKLKVLVLPYMSFAPFFIAQEEGYFAEQGLEVEFVKMEGGSSKAIPALIQGELDVTAGTVSVGLLNAIARGGSLKIVADGTYIASSACPARTLLVRRELFETGVLTQPAHLKGRRISVNPNSTDGYYVEQVLRMADLTLDDVSTEYVPSSVRLEGLQTGAFDAVYDAEPAVTRILQTGNAVVWMPAGEIIPDFQYAAVLYGVNLLQNHPDAGRRFMVTYLKAVRQYNQGKTARNIEILAQHTGLAPELLQEVCWSTIRADGSINADSLLDFQKWALEKGLLDSIISEDLFWDGSFAEYANEVLATSSQ